MGEIILYAFNALGEWKLFEKSGEQNWKALIPYYNKYICCKLAGCVPLFVVEIVLYVVSLAAAVILSLVGVLFSATSFFSPGAFPDIISGMAAGGLALFGAVIAVVYMVVFTVLNIMINLKLVKCYTDEMVFKVLAVLGGFPPLYFIGCIMRFILGFDSKYQYRRF